jgi:hypothetical protein
VLEAKSLIRRFHDAVIRNANANPSHRCNPSHGSMVNRQLTPLVLDALHPKLTERICGDPP